MFSALLLRSCCKAYDGLEIIKSQVYYLLRKKFCPLEKLHHFEVESLWSWCLLASKIRRCEVIFEFFHQGSGLAVQSNRGLRSAASLQCYTLELRPDGSWRYCLAVPVTYSTWILRSWAYKVTTNYCSLQVRQALQLWLLWP